MGDRIRVELPVWEIYLSIYPGQLNLAIPPWVGAWVPAKGRWCSMVGWLESKGRYCSCLVAGKTVWTIVNHVIYLSALLAQLLRQSAIRILVYVTLLYKWEDCGVMVRFHHQRTDYLEQSATCMTYVIVTPSSKLWRHTCYWPPCTTEKFYVILVRLINAYTTRVYLVHLMKPEQRQSAANHQIKPIKQT